jgi:hypothetical protein
MTQFCFSLFAQSKIVNELVDGGDRIEYGYLLLNRYKEVYDYHLGLLDDKINSLIFI